MEALELRSGVCRGEPPVDFHLSVKCEKKDLPFAMTKGEVIRRSVGLAILRVGRNFAIDEVVFAEPGIWLCLGRTLEGLNLPADSACKKARAGWPLAGGATQAVRRPHRAGGWRR